MQDGRIQDGCHHQVEREWMSEVLVFVQNGWMQEGRIQDGCHHQVMWEGMSLSQIELIWFRVRVEWECFWVNLREDNKVSESKMAVSEFNMVEFKMAAIIKLSQNEWEKFFCAKWLNPRWPNSRWLPSSSWVRMKEFESDLISLSQSFVQNGWIQDGRIQDGCHHQVMWEGISLRQIELVWFRVRVEWECFWVNLREDNNVSESKMAVSEFNMAEFKMATIIKLIRLNEWSILCKYWRGKSEWSFFLQMVGSNLGKCEWVWEEKLRWLNPRWQNSSWQNSR